MKECKEERKEGDEDGWRKRGNGEEQIIKKKKEKRIKKQKEEERKKERKKEEKKREYDEAQVGEYELTLTWREHRVHNSICVVYV